MASLLQSWGFDVRRSAAAHPPREGSRAEGHRGVPRASLPGHKPVAVRPSSHALKSGAAPGKLHGSEEQAGRAERNSADDVTMSGKVEWWMEEVALERSSLADEERERLARRRAARLAASEEQERRIRQGEITRAMEMVERMEEREVALRMEEAERRRRMKEADDHQRAALQEQHAQRSSALLSFVQERDRILSSAGQAGGAARIEPAVSRAMEREMQRRAASQMLSATNAPGDESSVSSAVLLQRILARFAEEQGQPADASGDRGSYPSTHASGVMSTVESAAGPQVDPTPRTEFSRRVKPVGLNNLSTDFSQDMTSTSTMNSTQDSAINPLMSFGSPSKITPNHDKLRMGGVAEEDSMLLSSEHSVLSEPVLKVRVSRLEARNLGVSAKECYLEVRCGVAQGQSRPARCDHDAVFEEEFSLPIAGEEEICVAVREWDRAAALGGQTFGRFHLK